MILALTVPADTREGARIALFGHPNVPNERLQPFPDKEE